MFRVVPYKQTSESAKLLAAKLSAVLGYEVISGPPSYDHSNVLWGSSAVQMTSMQPTAAIDIAKNKLRTLSKLKEAGVSVPEFTTSKQEAENWVRTGIIVVARQKLNASEGRGIVICKELPIVDAPLYVKLIDKIKEFRVHAMSGQVIDLQQKRRKNGARDANGNPPDGLIRNIGNDWVFCRNKVVEPPGLRDLGIAAVRAVGLLFGAVDIILGENGKLYVLEVNTAPGLTDTTATKYAQALVALPKVRW